MKDWRKQKPWHKNDSMFEEYIVKRTTEKDSKKEIQIHLRLPDQIKEILKRIRFVNSGSFNSIIVEILMDEFRKHKYDTYRKNLF